MNNGLRRVRGMQDILPFESWKWQYVERTLQRVSELFGFQEFRTPIVEFADLFIKGIGEDTDVVGKEMYVFSDRNEDVLCLRPEMTASIVRAVVEHSLLQQQGSWKIWYYGPMFRRERPQKGRYRQFYQYGVEVIGSPYPESDVEVIALAWQILQSFGLQNIELRINSLGKREEQERYREALLNYLSPFREQLSRESQYRLERNPLRILDSKDEKDRALLANAPKIIDFLGDESTAHFQMVLQFLQKLHIPYTLDPYLVRGLDYYCHTAFEIVSNSLGAQNAVCGGGRYDDLAKVYGADPFPAVGFALGIERLILLLEEESKFPSQKSIADVYVICTGEDLYSETIATAYCLRQAGLRVIYDLQRRSVKAQMREANKFGVPFVLILGQEELRRNMVLLKSMQSGEQWELNRDTFVEEVKSRIRAVIHHQ